MNILFLNAYFSPEKIAYSHLEKDLIEGFLDAGYRIQVLCPVPTRGISKETAKEYASRKQDQLYEGRVQIRRFWAPQEGRNPLIRAFRYFWCNFRQYCIGKKFRDIDLIFAVSTPPTQGWLAGKLSKKLKCGFVYNLQDIFPDSLVTTGLTHKGSLLWKIGRYIEDKTYKSADAIIVVSEAMGQNILQKGVPEEKIRVVSNWIDTDEVKPVTKNENRLFEEFGISREEFTVVYAGNFGAAQGANVVLEAAKLLPEVQFVIFGGGAEFQAAKATAAQLGNVIVNDLLEQNRVPEVYSLGDVALITCKKGVGNSGMPSKTWSIMACNTPIVAAFDTDSELAETVKRANAGICVEPENAQLLAEGIKAIQNNAGVYDGGRAYVCAFASKSVCVAKYIDAIK